jgi:hypothetical protein
MDSDQMSGALSKRLSIVPERDSMATNVSIVPSLQSSINTVNSNTALLGNKKAAQPPAAQLYTAFDDGEEDMMPKRKTRRVKDPYAIDFSDEEDDDMQFAPAAKPKRQEESLIDFLNSVPPPPGATDVKSIFADVPPPQAKKEGFRSRFSRSGSISSMPSSASLNSKPTYVGAPAQQNGSRPATNASSVKGAKSIPIRIPNQLYETSISTQPQQGTPGYSLSPQAQRTPAGRVPQKSFQPREAIAPRSSARDLADFLNNTPPPPSITSPGSTPSIKSSIKEDSGFRSIFGRRKKVAA